MYDFEMDPTYPATAQHTEASKNVLTVYWYRIVLFLASQTYGNKLIYVLQMTVELVSNRYR